MKIMTAGMHHSRMFRREIYSGVLGHRQRINVGAQGNCPRASRVSALRFHFPLDSSDDAGSTGYPLRQERVGNPRPVQFSGNEPGGLPFPERQLRMTVKAMSGLHCPWQNCFRCLPQFPDQIFIHLSLFPFLVFRKPITPADSSESGRSTDGIGLYGRKDIKHKKGR